MSDTDKIELGRKLLETDEVQVTQLGAKVVIDCDDQTDADAVTAFLRSVGQYKPIEPVREVIENPPLANTTEDYTSGPGEQ